MISPIGFFCFLALAAIQAVYLFTQKAEPFSLFLLPAGTLLCIISLIDRSIRIGFPAVTNMYESLLFFAAATGTILSVYRLRRGMRIPVRTPGRVPARSAAGVPPDEKDSDHETAASAQSARFFLFGGSIFIIILLAIASSPLAPSTIRPPVPALRSAWLVLHVTFAFSGEAFFAVSFVAALLYLFTRGPGRQKSLDKLIYTTIAVGYPVFTAGALIFGAIWAQYAWGRYWGWDPKETWALVTWLVYTLYLHFRFIRSKSGRIPAFIAVIGFLFTLFTFLGVNFLLSGKHSYG
ncbi:MAG: cytochrome c biogenesis protein CcsA [Spirochaetia bacterium]